MQMGTEIVPIEDDEAVIVEHEIERRDVAGALSARDRLILKRAKAIRDSRISGKSISDTARDLGDCTRSVLTKLIADTPLYDACLRILSKTNNVVSHEEAETAVATAKQLLAITLPSAVQYLRSCLELDPTTGKPVDMGLAQWATQELLKLGALKTDGASMAGTAIITAEAMRTLLGAIRGDDKKRETTVTVTVEPTNA
jgi:hypothetical protein